MNRPPISCISVLVRINRDDYRVPHTLKKLLPKHNYRSKYPITPGNITQQWLADPFAVNLLEKLAEHLSEHDFHYLCRPCQRAVTTAISTNPTSDCFPLLRPPVVRPDIYLLWCLQADPSDSPTGNEHLAIEGYLVADWRMANFASSAFRVEGWPGGPKFVLTLHANAVCLMRDRSIVLTNSEEERLDAAVRIFNEPLAVDQFGIGVSSRRVVHICIQNAGHV